jgi:hypothetical protein
MTTQIYIGITHGTASVTDEDKYRAETAALKVLGDVDPAVAYAEYLRQFEEIDGIEGMTGLAALWAQAQAKADIALTEGWYNPNGAGCEISA